jgi:exodeoxyribonuclease VII small subunit
MSRRPQRADADATAGEAPLPFESALANLEDLVDRLEGGELSLEEALASFELGVALSRRCAEELERAERRVEMLVQGEDGSQRRRLDPDEES